MSKHPSGGSEDWFICPHCGAEVARRARACPECGSDDRTGWSEDVDLWGAGIPAGYSGEDEFDYQEFIKREFGEARRELGPVLRLVALALAVVAAIGLLVRCT